MTTTRLVEWFEKEAAGYVALLERGAADLGTEPLALDTARSCARALAGAARLAGEDRVQRAAAALERGLRLSETDPAAARRLADDLRLTIADLRYLLEDADPDAQRDARADAAVARWAGAGEEDDRPYAGSGPADDWAAFVVREIADIADVTDRGIAMFAEDPTNREWLGAILRRQRTLLGSARLEEIPVLTEALNAVEDLCGLIVRLGVPIKSEWLDVFRCARDVLRSAESALEEGGTPVQTPALSRLRTLREELVARYGDRVASQPVEAEPSGARAETGPAPDPRQRAAVLRAELAQAVGDRPALRQSLDELYGMLMSALR